MSALAGPGRVEGQLGEERLVVGLPPAEGVATEPGGGQVTLDPDEAVGPGSGDQEALPEQDHLALLVRPAQVDDAARRAVRRRLWLAAVPPGRPAGRVAARPWPASVR